MREFHLQIVTPDGLVFDGNAEGILVRTDGGDVEIMSGHTDYFATLGIGRAKLTAGGVSRNASASGGFISVKNGEVRLVAVTFEFSDEIDIDRAKRAKENAEDALRSENDEKAMTVLKAKLARAINRISVAELK
jgi:F-type H+-transporting ATPase subunit epsilon